MPGTLLFNSYISTGRIGAIIFIIQVRKMGLRTVI